MLSVLKARLRPLNSTHVIIARKMRVFKSPAAHQNNAHSTDSNFLVSKQARRKFRRQSIDVDSGNGMILLAESSEGRCQCAFAEDVQHGVGHIGNYLVMGNEERRTARNGDAVRTLNAKLVLSWRQDKV